MVRLLVGTDGPRTSELLVDYLEDTLADEDEVYLVNSLPGGDATTGEETTKGREALDVLVEGLDGSVVESHQYVRGNAPVEDLLAAADEFGADEYVIGIRKRTAIGKIVFGSTAQNLLLESSRPVRCVPLISD